MVRRSFCTLPRRVRYAEFGIGPVCERPRDLDQYFSTCAGVKPHAGTRGFSVTADRSRGVERGKGGKGRQPVDLAATVPSGDDNDRPNESPHFWAAFVLAGDPE
jgi:hypothetical protein